VSRTLLIATLAVVAAAAVGAQQNHVDLVTLMAPELAAFGPHDIGVRTLQVTDKNRPDVLNTSEGGPIARYDRMLTLEAWYPATLAAGQAPRGEYRIITFDAEVTATMHGKAVRDAAPKTGRYPLVIISHGYPGNRYLMMHMGENLASKGYVAVAIDHKDSTPDDLKSFASTLYNRPFDQLFVLNEIDRLSQPGSGSFLAGLVDASRTGIIGYSMGGYGVVNAIGGGYSAASAAFQSAPPNRMLAERGAANPAYQKGRDPRIKAAIAIGPWGMQGGFWDAAGLAGIHTPVMFVAGSNDTTSGYEKGTRAIFEAAVNADRYLLTFIDANHNAAAPMPAPAEVLSKPGLTERIFNYYNDPVWDNVRMNNIFDHFATAYFGVHLKDEADKQAYLDLSENGKDGTWKGFKRNTAVGLRLEHRTPASSPPPRAR
jgi:predicted dienelactone hydrolase